jgi:hypothetical protein
MSTLSELMKAWKTHKAREQAAQDARREIEDEIKRLLNYDETKEGTQLHKDSDLKMTISNRFSKKIDSDLLQEIAAENGTNQSLSYLFNWKPSIDAKAWKAADQSITTPLLRAIETKPGRPSFKIENI